MDETWLPWLSAGLTALIAARWCSLRAHENSRRLTDVIGAALMVLAWHSNLWTPLAQGYTGDTLYNLTVTGRAGLMVLTVLLVLVLLSGSSLKSRWLQQLPRSWAGAAFILFAIDLVLTFLLFVAAETFVPQLYYSYYLLLFDYLSQQWVVKPPTVERIWLSLRMASDAGSSLHAIGFTGWWMLMLVVLSWLKQWRLGGRIWWWVGVAFIANLAWHVLV